MAEAPLDVTMAYIEKLKSPDSHSRSKNDEGRTILEIDGGFYFVNHFKHRDRGKKNRLNGTGPAPTLITGRGETRDKEIETHADTYTDSETFPNRETTRNYRETQNGNRETWSPTEKQAYETRPNDAHRRFFEIARGFAELAALNKEPDFPLATRPISEKLGITEQGAGKIRRKAVDDGIIKETVPYSYSAKRSARFRWTLESTLPIPAMLEPDFDEDNPDGQVF
jgi:hypothetical protein